MLDGASPLLFESYNNDSPRLQAIEVSYEPDELESELSEVELADGKQSNGSGSSKANNSRAARSGPPPRTLSDGVILSIMGLDPQMAQRLTEEPLHHEVEIRPDDDLQTNGSPAHKPRQSTPYTGVDIKDLASAALTEESRLETARRGRETSGVPSAQPALTSEADSKPSSPEQITQHAASTKQFDSSTVIPTPSNGASPADAKLAPMNGGVRSDEAKQQTSPRTLPEPRIESRDQPSAGSAVQLPGFQTIQAQMGSDSGLATGPGPSPTPNGASTAAAPVPQSPTAYYTHQNGASIPLMHHHPYAAPASPISPRKPVPPQYQPIDPALDGAGYSAFQVLPPTTQSSSTDYPTPQDSTKSGPSHTTNGTTSDSATYTPAVSSPENAQAQQPQIAPQFHQQYAVPHQPPPPGAPIAPMIAYLGPNLQPVPMMYRGSIGEHGGQIPMAGMGSMDERRHAPPNGQMVMDYPCDYEGCNVPPFATLYLLNSHKNAHSENRPFLCPISNCPHAKPPKGFKRRNELNRHKLSHESPGYPCPYCTDRGHQYPRPDNLIRHVKAHHKAKDRDDPVLQEVLNMRVDGTKKARRKRAQMH